MFEISVYDAIRPDILAYARQSGYERAVATQEYVDFYSSLRSLIEFFYYVLVGDMVYFHFYPSLVTLFGVVYFLADEFQQFRFHLVRRNEQLAEFYRLERLLYKLKHFLHLPHYLRSSRHHHIVGINLCVAFVKVSCAYAGYVSTLA